jgi:predicted amidohydrolase
MMPTLIEASPWAPHADATPVNRQCAEPDQYESKANGTLSCCGGWQFRFVDVQPGHNYRVSWKAQWKNVAQPLDMLVGHVYWGEVATDCYATGTSIVWDYVEAELSGTSAAFSAELKAPDNAQSATIRCTLRWTAAGGVTWSQPLLQDLGAAADTPPVRVAVATGSEELTQGAQLSLQHGIERYASLAERACDEGAQLIALPEICLQWNVPGHAYEHAVEVPGPEVEVFQKLARTHSSVIAVGLNERADGAVYNSAVVIDSDGEIAGVYHKVHLASTEAMSGIMPGDGFPVMDTNIGRVGCTICMDSSASESARMIGLNGAHFLLLPIMGDHRASRWSPGPGELDEDRWRCIQRTRAMDNQLCMVVARNRGRGSCIIDRSGEILAYNDGTQDVIVADVAIDDGFRKWNGGCFRQVNWRQRRPHLYGAHTLVEPTAMAQLRTIQGS